MMKRKKSQGAEKDGKTPGRPASGSRQGVRDLPAAVELICSAVTKYPWIRSLHS